MNSFRSLVVVALLPFGASATAAPCRNPSLGADLTNISNSIRRDRDIPEFVDGALVRVVPPKTPAARAGLLAGDVIQAVGSNPAGLQGYRPQTGTCGLPAGLRWRERPEMPKRSPAPVRWQGRP